MRHVYYRPMALTLSECFENEIFLKYTLTYLNWISKLHHLMQSSLRSSLNVDDGRKRQHDCLWNTKIRGKKVKSFVKYLNFELKQCRISYNWFDINSLDGRIEFDKKLIIESNCEIGFLAHFEINLNFKGNSWS